MMMKMGTGKRRLSISMLPYWLKYNCSTFTSKPQVHIPNPESHHSETGYQALLQVLEACKFVPNLRTAIAMHAKIVKHGRHWVLSERC